MYDSQLPALDSLADWFNRLPGIGQKTAQRLAYHTLTLSDKDANDFAAAIINAHEKIHQCSVCCNLTQDDICKVCASAKRDRSIICVVQQPKDVIALERTHEYQGLYHVLNGTLSPLGGVGPDDISIKQLMDRLKDGDVKEIIMATSATVDGEATAIYISGLIKPLGIKVSRLAYGLPVGGDLDFADEVTILKSLNGRNEI